MRKEWAAWGPFVLRVIVGIGFVYHGFPKLFSGPGHQMTVGMLTNIGIPLPELASWVVGIVEFFGGLALIAGAFVTVAGGLLAIDMLVAIFTAHPVYSFVNIIGMTESGPQFGFPGWEVPLVYFGALVALILGGPGAWSVDGMRAVRASGGPRA